MSQARFYVVMHRGIPVEVSAYESNALEAAKQRSVPGYPATVVGVVPQQLELFPDGEDDTIPDAPRSFCVNENYEVGSGQRCYGRDCGCNGR